MQEINNYRITINKLEAATPGDGFIDPTLANNYLDDSTGEITGWPSSNSLALAKARANVRWGIVIEQLGLTLNVLGIKDIVVTGADINTAPTTVSFTVVYDRPSALFTDDEYNSGSVLSGTDAIVRFVERALLTTRTQNYTVLNSVSNVPDPLVKSYETVKLVIGPVGTKLSDVSSLITVSEITGLTS